MTCELYKYELKKNEKVVFRSGYHTSYIAAMSYAIHEIIERESEEFSSIVISRMDDDDIASDFNNSYYGDIKEYIFKCGEKEYKVEANSMEKARENLFHMFELEELELPNERECICLNPDEDE